jgi:hypothetical protein
MIGSNSIVTAHQRKGSKMLSSTSRRSGKTLPHDPAARGYLVVYREDQVNHCPGCGRSHWHVGRVSAECGFCGTALPLAEATTRGWAVHSRNFRPVFPSYAA